ncbi:MAG: tRNA (Guanine-N(1)-)-methyltransferase [uncultured bacterium]|nr:MAG: tRNA (Guanine-N(1)-)-methyltransferase [uncultured bacterium]
MKVSILTLFPKMFEGPFDLSIIQRAKEKKLIEINFVDIRDFGIGKHKTVDDKPYGGGIGMILKVDVLKNALDSVTEKKLKKNEQKIILLSATGEIYNQTKARDFSKLKHLIIICGHYEGVDERIKDFIDEEISIGDFVLTGGEIPAMLIIDSVGRLVKGVLKKGATENESFSEANMHLEHAQFTRPYDFKGLKVPAILLSGNHEDIDAWKKKTSLEKTKNLRIDLLKKGTH